MSFDDTAQVTKVGDFPAYDFFGDGSFYLLDAPGHAIGHLGGLARTTTNPDTFIFMGGDLCHHGGQIRPSQNLHIPSDLSDPSFGVTTSHPGHLFEKLISSKTGSNETPLFVPAPAQIVSEEDSTRTRIRAQKADAQDHIWFIYAHDPSLSDVVDFFPCSANDWKAKNWRSKTLWNFLGDLQPVVDELAAKVVSF